MFKAPIYYEETVNSTMDFSRRLAAKGEAHGTVICADYQENGRGRGRGRLWQAKKGESLLFTILLRYPQIEEIPKALTLRTGLALAQAIEEFEPSLDGRIKIKWPNDIMLNEQSATNNEQRKSRFKKTAGILCEADGGIVHIGIGVNVLQKTFPPELQNKATSISLASGKDIKPEKRIYLLKLIINNIYKDLADSSDGWKTLVNERLYLKGEQVLFIEGYADSGKEVKGVLKGIGDNGGIIIDNHYYLTGELKIY